MKPIQLRIAGLHSYLDEQTIDFSQLCGLGVFGIFGPTGAGKSTVLDAMTLALYGKVERAPRGTEGIIHQAEKHLTVSFTFELGQNPRQRYRVERTYRRRDNAAHCAKARLLQVTADRDSVLEEGGPKVTQQVEAILGLEAKDFTRAVVLPQGKFAEFLSLRGSERCQMLERIFNLQEYGNQLIERVKTRTADMANKQRDLDMEQQGLGEASEQALAACRTRLEEAMALESIQGEERKNAEQQYLQFKDHWDKQTELARVEARERDCRSRLPLVEDWDNELDAAVRAESVHALLTEANESRTALDQAARRLQASQAAFQDAEAVFQTAANNFTRARADRQQEESGLITRQAVLEQALKTEESLGKLAEDNVRMHKEFESLTAEVAALQQIIATGARDKDVLEAACAQAQVRLNELRVSPEERHHMATANQALTAYRKAAQNHELLQLEWDAKDQEVKEAERLAQETECKVARAETRRDAAQEQAHRLEQAAPRDDGLLTEQAGELGRLRALVERVRAADEAWENARAALAKKSQGLEQLEHDAIQADREAAQATAAFEEMQKQRQESVRRFHDFERRNLAAHLAAALEKGQPCPVCGSLEHPQPAPAAASILEKARAELREAEEDEKQASLAADGARENATKVRARREALRGHTLEAEQEAVHRQRERDKARANLPEEQRDWSTLEMLGWLVRLETEHRGRTAALAEWKKNLASCRADLERDREELNQAQQDRAALNQRCQGARSALADLTKKMRQAEEEENQLRGALDQARGPLTLDDLVAAQHAIHRRDQEFDALHHAFQGQGKRLADRSKKLGQQHLDLAAKETDLGRLGERRAALADQMAEQQAKLAGWTGGVAAASLLAEVKAQLVSVQKTEEQAEKAQLHAQAARTLQHQEVAAAGEAWKSCTAQWEKANQKLTLGLAQADFADIAKASAALRTEEERNQLRKQIDGFRLEEQGLANERHNLELKIRHRRIQAEDWQQCQARRTEAETNFQAALAARGAAAEALQDMERKHARWQELVAAKARLAPEAKNLQILQGLFRGNEFVEFLAAQQLHHIAWSASEQLGQLTRYRYALEVDSESGFVIRDDANGGSKRPTSTLSGGETFLASLALALALSKQIQLGNRYPLEFFFLDEGFGSLDAEVLEVVITALERLNLQNMTVGVISHVPELRYRIPRRLLVDPAEPGGRGTQVHIEKT